MPDVTLKPPPYPRTSQSPSYTDVCPRLPLHLLMGTFFLKITEPCYGQVLPLLPKARAFLLFRVWLQTFLPASSKSNNSPSVPWEHRGGRARWERGIRHTARTRGQPVGKENAHGEDRKKERKRKRSLHLKGAFSS